MVGPLWMSSDEPAQIRKTELAIIGLSTCPPAGLRPLVTLGKCAVVAKDSESKYQREGQGHEATLCHVRTHSEKNKAVLTSQACSQAEGRSGTGGGSQGWGAVFLHLETACGQAHFTSS